MKMVRCDRCGALYEQEQATIRKVRQGVALYNVYDLCTACEEEFDEWLKAPKAVAEMLFAEQGKEHEAK